MTIYYAHSLNLYDTNQEGRDLHTLNKIGEVINPNEDEHQIGYKVDGMDYFKELIGKCDLLAFRAHPDGSIPAGIFKEINFAKENFTPILEIPSGITRRELTVGQTREYLKEVGLR